MPGRARRGRPSATPPGGVPGPARTLLHTSSKAPHREKRSSSDCSSPPALIAGGASAQTPSPTRSPRSRRPRRSTSRSPAIRCRSRSSAPNNEPAGYSIDICKRVIAQIGRAVGEPNLKVNWMVGSVTERLAMVASGTRRPRVRQHDADAGAPRQRRLLATSSSSTAAASSSRPTRRSTRSPTWRGKKIAVLRGTTTETRLRDTLQRRLVNATVVPIDDANEGMAMLEIGQRRRVRRRQDQAGRPRRAGEGPGQARDARRGPVVRALRPRASRATTRRSASRSTAR